MKIALITYPIETNPTGIGVNVQNIVQNLIDLDPHNTYFLLHFMPSSNPIYRKNEILAAIASAQEFILLHQFFLSDRTGEIISKSFLKFSYPCRWKYDILRALDYFQDAKCKRDERMSRAIEVIENKRNKNGTWNTQAAHPGKVHFVMENAGKPGRWNTLRALRVLEHFKKLIDPMS